MSTQQINDDAPRQEPGQDEISFARECKREAVNRTYKKYRIFVHTSDDAVEGLYRAVYTVLDQQGQQLVLGSVQDAQQKMACTQAWNTAKKFVDARKK